MNKKIIWSVMLLPVVAAPVAVVASCSDTNSDLNNALRHIKAYLDENQYKRIDKKASDVQIKDLPVFEPSKIFGFNMKWVSPSNDETKDNDDKKGEKKVNLILSRWDVKDYVQPANILGYLTTDQEQSEQNDPEIKILDKLNAKDNRVVLQTIKKDINFATAYDILSRQSNDKLLATLKEFINFEKPAGANDNEPKNWLFKTKLDPNVKLKASVVKKATHIRIPANYLYFDLILSKPKDDRTHSSRPVKIFINGWKDEEKDFETKQAIHDWLDAYSTIDSPVDYNKSKDVLASEIQKNGIDKLKEYLKSGFETFGKIKIELKAIKASNDQTGSLEIEVSAQVENKAETKIDATITLYGFKQVPKA